MGTEAAWVPLVLAGLGAGVKYADERQQGKKQDNILSQQLQRNAARERDADRAVADALRERTANGAEQDRATSATSYLDQVRASLGSATQGLGQAGAVSSAYRDAASDAAMGVSSYGNDTANLMARIDAPALQRNREAKSSGNLAVMLDRLGNKSQSDDYITQLRLRNVKGNPWMQAAAAMLSGAASGMSGGAASGTAGAAGAGSMSGFGSEAGSWFSNPALWRTS